MDKLSIGYRQAIVLLFLEGFASVAIQFLILRQLTPFVGNSVIITSIVISVFLGSLALGYKVGGSVKSNHRKILSSNLFKASIILGIFSSYSFFLVAYDNFSSIHPIIVTVVYLLLFMAPMVYLIAQTIPIMVNFMKAERSSQKTGDALLFSTIGNVFGGIITTVVIMYFLGISWAIFITVSILLFISFFISEDKSRSLFFIIPAILIIFRANITYDNEIFVASNAYANYAVIETKSDRHFIANRSNSSKINLVNKNGHPYIESIKSIINRLGSDDQEVDVLIIGSGGFSLTADNTLNAKVHYIDIDGQIKRIAEEYFLKEDIKGDFIGEDARVFLMKNKKKFDFIVVDAYSNQVSIPGELTTKEFYEIILNNLKGNGYMISNIVSDPFMKSQFSKRMSNTISSVFPLCYNNVIAYSHDIANVLYVCYNSKEAFASESRTVYTDDTNKSVIDYFLSII